MDTSDEWIDLQLAGRGITDERVLEAFRTVPRAEFVPEELADLAHEDAPLPIGGGQTISQPFIVALTLEALELHGGERVLEVGAGSGYAAAVASRLAGEVFTVERLESLADDASKRLARLGFTNVRVRCGDGTLGWPEHAPYDAIAVAAGGPAVPRALLDQLAPGGRLVMPVGADADSQTLVRITREHDGRLREDSLGPVRFVPLIGEQGWPDESGLVRAPAREDDRALPMLIRECGEPLRDLDAHALDALIDRIGDARLVLLGEATHGTSEFYRLRARLSRALIERCGFDFVAVEADWPDAMRIHRYVTDAPRSHVEFAPFSRFPTWMWRNEEVSEFVEWLRAHNLGRRERARRAGFYGLDLYSMFTSIAHVLAYLDDVDPDAARVARARYGMLTPWQQDPAAYGQAVLVGRYASSETAVVAMLRDMLERRLDYAGQDGEAFFDAAQNAHVVTNAERYYRAMYYGSAASWNLRDTHMFHTLQALLGYHGPDARGIVWEHNSHLGNAEATEMSVRGELNVGQLCREQFGDAVYAVGFGTDHGTVAAASDWGGPMQRMQVRPSLPGSYERLCHDARVPAFLLPLRAPRRPELRDELMQPRLERAIGVIYRPDSERMSHYFHASLPLQFDEYVWFDETHAVEPLQARSRPSPELPETYPFGL
ncbi:protein-L-isoaspartate(D-aspartate) O-methyltransferase [Nannocystis sp. RBIL2]|uniref:protein-L-isoaspartate(D-aspartate) O-methyltransferase n=1 Tax=Nannocystis sp. RBIL2 TaxID=2996788 RepID=UPI00227163F1|nr:protein-L-isoaspartate(D-aspartate) O-methyltransferase [Nannocystis sp. RBIL2]MCY1071592.1 protein-L-isoaspartate(D-aspartate) O-methyltransferase [Nannocystis sp. RBIL2]